MSRIAYLNGRYLPHRAATVHVEDRGFQFADGVYEVIAFVGGAYIDLPKHLDRLERSLAALRIPLPMSRTSLDAVIPETVRRNRLKVGIVYLQINRGAARRDHAFPQNARPSVVVTARRHAFPLRAGDFPGVRVVSTGDLRWARCDIKSVSLLPNVLAKQHAVDHGAFEAWMIDGNGLVREGSSTNAWIVDDTERVLTHPKGPEILGGITRDTMISLARDDGIEVVERPFSLDEAKAAREAFLTSTTTFLRPVIRIDDDAVGNGRAGATSLRLLDLYIAYAWGKSVCR